MIPIILIAAFAATTARTPGCQPATGIDARALLDRAAVETGLNAAHGSVLKVDAFDVRQHAFESDRMYPPSLVEVTKLERWFDPTTGVARVTSRSTIGGYEFGASTIGDAAASYAVHDTTLIASESLHGMSYETRPLDVWAVLVDWMSASDVQVEGRCTYRDYPRIVLRRGGLRGPERLFLDPKSGYPTKLDRVEPHYFWGQVHVEFVYSTWQRVAGAHIPGASFRLEDGTTVVARTFGARRFVPRDSAPSLRLPTPETRMAIAPPEFLAPSRPDTVRVGETIFLLRNRGFTETVALVHDTVFVFDATQGDERVAEDSAWIQALFPGRHPIVLVVTDLAWPHIAGMRAWIARGAAVIGHRAARPFLERVVARRWTLQPDLLERRRRHAAFHFRAVDDSLALANGDILLFPIDGAASEVALAAFVRPDRFLWASDFIQDLSEPTQYLDEVVAATRRVGIAPARFAAEHVPLTDWNRVRPLAAR
jgi:hypothetical protein